MGSVGDFFELIRKVDALLTLDRKYGDTLQALRQEIREINVRLTRLEAREEIVVEQAKAAAAASASTVMMHTVADMARSLEARTPSGRLAAPE